MLGKCLNEWKVKWRDELPDSGQTLPLLLRVPISQQLHANDGEDVNDNDQHKGQVTQCAQRASDDWQQDSHRRPGPRKFEHSHLEHIRS